MILSVSNVADSIKNALIGIRDPIANAATAAMVQGGADLKNRGRANIAAAGFSTKWQNAWRVQVFPKRGTSVDAAAFGFHKIPFSAIFEDGGVIRGLKGLLWIPLSNVPKIGQKIASPSKLAAAGVKLFSLRRPGGNPLLATSIRVSGAKQASGKFTVSKLQKGTAGVRGTVETIPLFVGLDSVTIKKKFALDKVADTVRAELPSLYFANLKA